MSCSLHLVLTISASPTFPPRPNAEVLPEDKKLPAFVANFFKVLLVAGGPTPSIDRLNAVISNSAENEPFLVGLAAALAVSGSAPSWGSSALLAYTAFRIFHAISYLAAIRQPARAVAWVGGSVACLSLAAVALAGIFKK